MTVVMRLVKNEASIYFREPVCEEEAPNYSSIISNPMDLRTVKEKLQNGLYRTTTEFDQDVNLIWDNCDTFNPKVRKLQ